MPDSIVGEKYIDFHEIAGFVVKLPCVIAQGKMRNTFYRSRSKFLLQKDWLAENALGKTKKVPPHPRKLTAGGPQNDGPWKG